MGKDLTNVTGYIYKVTSPNGKVYIGQTNNYYKRKSTYKYNAFSCQTKLWNSCQKHNWNPSETFEVIEKCLCGENKSILNEKEIYWVKFYDSFENGLNCNKGGEGNVGRIWSDESKKKASLSKIGKITSKETKARISKANVGRKLSDTTKQKQSLAKSGIPKSAEHKDKLKITSTGNKNCVGRKYSKETIKKMRKTKLGKVTSEETKEKLRNSAKQYWANIKNPTI